MVYSDDIWRSMLVYGMKLPPYFNSLLCKKNEGFVGIIYYKYKWTCDVERSRGLFEIIIMKLKEA